MSELTQDQILAMANDIAEVDDDMNEVQIGGGGFNRRLPEGWAVARFTSYIEKGKHIELFNGKAKDPQLAFTLGFELSSPGYANDDGTPYFMETFDISRSRNEKAKAFKWFKQMNYLGKAKVFPQMLGQVFIVKIADHLSPKAKPGTEPRSIITDVQPGLDPVTRTPYACPPATKLFLFSWAKPTLEGWDSFFIDGVNDAGKSKNWVQAKMTGAVDFKGSVLEGLLMAAGRPIPEGTPQKAAVASAAPAGAVAPAAAPQGVVAPVVAPVTAAVVNPGNATAGVVAPASPSVPAVAVVTAPSGTASVAPAVAVAPVVVAPAVTAPVVAEVAAPLVVAPVVAPVVAG